MTDQVAALVVCWRETALTIRALRSIAASNATVGRVLCVAQELDAGQQAELSTHAPPGTEIVFLDENIGFAAACNLGIRRAAEGGAHWVLILNNDAVVDPDCLGVLLGHLSDNTRVACIGPAVAWTSRPGRLWYGGGVYSRNLGFTRHRNQRVLDGRCTETQYVPACCVLMDTEAWEAVGDFREDLFLYYEDAEWARRARRSGYRCLYVARVLALHDGSASAGRPGSYDLTETSAYYIARNSLLCVAESDSRFQRVVATGSLLGIYGMRNMLRLEPGRRARAARSYVAGLADGLRRRGGPRSMTPTIR